LAEVRRARLGALAPIAVVEIVGGATVVLTSLAIVWARVSGTPAQHQMLSLTVAAALTGLNVAVLMTLGLSFLRGLRGRFGR
jgi:hypothetical protein